MMDTDNPSGIIRAMKPLRTALVLLWPAASLLAGCGVRDTLRIPDPPPAAPTTTAPSPNPGTEDKAGWETFRNEKQGFSVRYPSTWERTISAPKNGTFTLIVRSPIVTGELER